MNTSDLISTSIQRKISVGTQPIKLSTSIKVVCRSGLGCMTSQPICNVVTTFSQRCVPTGLSPTENTSYTMGFYEIPVDIFEQFFGILFWNTEKNTKKLREYHRFFLKTHGITVLSYNYLISTHHKRTL